MLRELAPGSYGSLLVVAEAVLPAFPELDILSPQLFLCPGKTYGHVHPSHMLSVEVFPVEYCTFGQGLATMAGGIADLRALTLLAYPVMQKDMLGADMALPFILGRECGLAPSEIEHTFVGACVR